jgi:polyhydroxyalkanoate synthesis regulator phasin
MAARARERQTEAEERILAEIEGSLVRLGVPTRPDVQALQNQLDGIAAKVDSLVALRGQDTSH